MLLQNTFLLAQVFCLDGILDPVSVKRLSPFVFVGARQAIT